MHFRCINNNTKLAGLNFIQINITIQVKKCIYPFWFSICSCHLSVRVSVCASNKCYPFWNLYIVIPDVFLLGLFVLKLFTNNQIMWCELVNTSPKYSPNITIYLHSSGYLNLAKPTHNNKHTHTHTHIYMYVHMCVCVYFGSWLQLVFSCVLNVFCAIRGNLVCNIFYCPCDLQQTKEY